MFNFRKKKLDPVLAQAIEKVDEILKLDDVTEKTERLLALKEALDNTVGKMGKRESGLANKAWLATLATGLGVLFVPIGGVAMPFLIALSAGGLVGRSKFRNNSVAANKGQRIIEDKIDRAINSLIATDAQAVLKSPRFQKSLKNTFNIESEADFRKMAERLAPKGNKPKKPNNGF